MVMKKYLLLILFFPALIIKAQTTDQNSDCKAMFSYETQDILMSPLPSMAVRFTDESEGNVKSWMWDFGDGQTSYEQNPSHIYYYYNGSISNNGMINPFRIVTLTISTVDSCKSFYSDTFLVFNNIPDTTICQANFKYYQSGYDTIAGTADVQFTNLSRGDSLKYFWSFDDGETSTERNPLITFNAEPAEHVACLVIKGADNCTDSICKNIIITNPYILKDTTECSAAFGYTYNYDIQTFAPALVLDFYAKTENAVQYFWDFGDGSTSEEPNPTHIFNLPLDNDSMNYSNSFRQVCLTINTASGCTATWCDTISLYDPDTTYNEPPATCHAWFKYYVPTDIATIPELVPYHFIDASDGNVISRLWEFEDGTTSTEDDIVVNFSIFKSTQKVCLTIETDSCTSTWCETIFVNPDIQDTFPATDSSGTYIMRYESSYPIWASACIGWVKAQVYLGDSIENASDYVWSTGAEGQEVNGFCPTQIYTVKALTPDGAVVSGTFKFNSDGTVTVIPVNWWLSGSNEYATVRTSVADSSYTVQWKLCDGTVFTGDSIPLDLINCGQNEPNLILTDSMGNVVYEEKVSLKGMSTEVSSFKESEPFRLYPNPVNDVLNIVFNKSDYNQIQIEIIDLTGKTMLIQTKKQILAGQPVKLNVQSLPGGIYLCRVTNANQILGLQKFIR